MSLGPQALSALARLSNFTDERRELTVQSPQLRVTAELLGADRLSCAIAQVRLETRRALDLSGDDLRGWGQRLATRVRYMLEPIEPIELDPIEGQLLLRSAPPEKKSAGTCYYEVLLESRGRLTFGRRRFDPKDRARVPEPLHCTHETFEKLIDDLESAAPAA
jgi:hypothetical protein